MRIRFSISGIAVLVVFPLGLLSRATFVAMLEAILRTTSGDVNRSRSDSRSAAVTRRSEIVRPFSQMDAPLLSDN